MRPGNRAHGGHDLSPVRREVAGVGIALYRPGVPGAVEFPSRPQDGIAEAQLDQVLGDRYELASSSPAAPCARVFSGLPDPSRATIGRPITIRSLVPA